ncbi:sensor histidine kinase [Flindersiella endophytica]
MDPADPAAGVRLGPRPAAAAGGHPRLEWLSDGLLVCLPPLVGGVMALAGGIRGPYWPMVLLTLAESLTLAWYRRFPLAVLIVVTGMEFALAALDIPVFVGILVAATGLGAWGRPRQQRIGIAVVLGVLLTAGVLSLFLKHGEPLVVALVFAIVTILIVGFVAIGRAGARQRVRIQELREHSRRLEAARELAGQLAAEHERALLARELHDILNHAVTAMVLDAEVAADTGKDTEVTLRRVASIGRESLAELRRLLGVLRDPPDGHDPLAVPPRLDQLPELVSGARGRLERRGEIRPVDASIELAVYRVVQESLTNVTKHAGGEVEAEVVLSYAPDSLDVRIGNAAGDRASRPAGSGGGLGLIGMRERVELLGGQLQAGPRPDGGFEVRAVLPLRGVAP